MKGPRLKALRANPSPPVPLPQGERGHAPRPAGAFLRAGLVWGPGVLVMLADTDAGNVVAAAQGGAEFGLRLLPLILALIPALYLTQELTVRLGIATGRGHAELIRQRYGLGWALVALGGLTVAAIGTLITEFTAVAGIGEMFGLPRGFTLTLAVAALVAIVGAGAYRRVERAALVVGLFELAFFFVAWKARPDFAMLARAGANFPLADRRFLYMAAALIGATFNPWMIFYQQSATVDKGLRAADLGPARADTLIGAVLTQSLTGAVLVAAAAAFAGAGQASLGSVGEIGAALTPHLGVAAGRIAFGAGVLGASLVAAIVASLALAWGLGEIFGFGRTLERRPFAARGFFAAYAAAAAGSAFVVWNVRDLVWLNVAAQALNAVLMPLTLGFLVALAATATPEPFRLSRRRLVLVAAISAAATAIGVAGVLGSML